MSEYSQIVGAVRGRDHQALRRHRAPSSRPGTSSTTQAHAGRSPGRGRSAPPRAPRPGVGRDPDPRGHGGAGAACPARDRNFEGRVARLSDDLDRQTRTMETEIDVANADASLVAGMYAETVLDLDRKDAALSVPIQAVSRKGTDATVLVVDAENRVE